MEKIFFFEISLEQTIFFPKFEWIRNEIAWILQSNQADVIKYWFYDNSFLPWDEHYHLKCKFLSVYGLYRPRNVNFCKTLGGFNQNFLL